MRLSTQWLCKCYTVVYFERGLERDQKDFKQDLFKIGEPKLTQYKKWNLSSCIT